uniref:Uncharacterized protein n=1 Tax=Populus alba TaxID=43335 RepID=A0A4U5QAM3_POPAL|nr:hypothetical protein D5086_0000116680 [Populus alba]
MELNDSYSAVHRQILLMSPLPSVRQAYSSVSQEEKQRLLSSTHAAIDFSSSVAMAVWSKPNPVRYERSSRPYVGHPKAKLNSGSRGFSNRTRPAVNNVADGFSQIGGSQIVGISEDQLKQLLSLVSKNDDSISQANVVTKLGSSYEEDDWFG